MSNILSISSDSKTIKGEKYGYLTGIFYGSPAQESGVLNACPNSSDACRTYCLYNQGRASVFKTIKEARIRKTKEFKFESATFREKLRKEIALLVKNILRFCFHVGFPLVAGINDKSARVLLRRPLGAQSHNDSPRIKESQIRQISIDHRPALPGLRQLLRAEHHRHVHAAADRVVHLRFVVFASRERQVIMAVVNIESGKEYRVPVWIEKGIVRQVEWPDGGNMAIVKDGELETDCPGCNVFAVGWNSRGEVVGIGGFEGL
jgi:hypothetical protein